MKKLELLYTHGAWLKSSFEKGRYLSGDEVVGPDGELQWVRANVQVFDDIVILHTTEGCAAVCRVVQDNQELQWPANAPAWANVILAVKDDMRMRVFAEDFRDGARAVGVNAGHLVQSSRITLSTNHSWIIIASRPGWVPEWTTSRVPCTPASAPTLPAQGPFAVFKGDVFQSSHISLQSAEASTKRNAGKSPGAVYTIYRPFRTIKGEITVKDI